MVLFEVVTRERPWKECQRAQEIYESVRCGGRPRPTSGAYDQGMPEGYETLMEACWDQNPRRRPVFEGIKEVLQRLHQQQCQRNKYNRVEVF